MGIKVEINNIIDHISKPAAGTVWVGKEYSVRDLLADLNEVRNKSAEIFLVKHDGAVAMFDNKSSAIEYCSGKEEGLIVERWILTGNAEAWEVVERIAIHAGNEQ